MVRVTDAVGGARPPLGKDNSAERRAISQRSARSPFASTCSDELKEVIETLTGSPVVSAEPVRGGDVSNAFRCGLADGTVIFTKTHPDPPADFFSTEAASLAWLLSAGARVPRVLAFGDADPAHLILEWIQPGRSTQEGDAGFGRMLARVHQVPFDCFGRPDTRTTGSQALPNPISTTWVEHYATSRLLPLARIGSERQALSDDTCRQLEYVASRLDQLGGAPEPPSLLHGDLWAGNRIVDSRGLSWMIDPASVGGHREFDLAMMRLFGGYGPDCFTAYNEVFPLADGWEDRVLLHQVAPLAVHAIKFGGHYIGALNEVLAKLRTRAGCQVSP